MTNLNVRASTLKGQPRLCPGCGRTFAWRGLAGHIRKCHVTYEQLFWQRVDQSDKDGCWPWLGEISNYGHWTMLGKHVLAHRCAWQFTHGKIKRGLHVLHTCDRMECCNPKHLKLGSHQDNMDDAYRKRRHAWGERSSNARLSKADVREIRRLRQEGIPCLEVAARFGITRNYVSQVACRHTWRLLP